MISQVRQLAPRMHLPLRQLALCLDCDECFGIGAETCPSCGSATWTSPARFLGQAWGDGDGIRAAIELDGTTGRQMAGGERGADTHAPPIAWDTSVPGDRAHPGAHEEPAPPLLHFRQPSQPRADMAEQWHLLIAHNGRQVREVLHQIFLGAGYKCLLANDGSAGLEAFRQSRPPLVITELNLPHSLPPSGVFGGIELLKQVRREDPDVAVIVVSDSPHRETATECLQLGADAYIRMPLNVDELLTAAERALRARQKYPTERGQAQVGVSRVGGQG